MPQAFLAQLALSKIMPFRPLACPAGFRVLCDDHDLRLFVSNETPHLMSEQGFIIGRLFSRLTMEPVQAVTPPEWVAIASSGGQSLFQLYWGDYVAFVRVPERGTSYRYAVLRAPFGRLGCYWQQTREKAGLASHPDLLARVGLINARLDAIAIARHVSQPEFAPDQTCLCDLSSLSGGDRLMTTPSGASLETLWTPWTFCADNSAIASIEDAGRILRGAVLASISAQIAEYPDLVLMLSGGLDSSILAVSLRAAGRSCHALTLVTEAATGDERNFARLAAQATQVPLSEIYRSLDGVNLFTSAAARAARPHARAFSQEGNRIAEELADLNHATILDGSGGDNLFFNYMSLAVTAEMLRKAGPGPRFWKTAIAMADLTGSGLAKLVAKTIHRAVHRDNRLHIRGRDTFLSARARAAIAGLHGHPWQEPPPSIGAGKAAHVVLLAAAKASAEQGRSFDGRHIRFSPFACQPLVETVLGLPIWCWFAPGLNRAAARSAFAKDLPPALIQRRSKGTPSSFLHALFEDRRPQIRSMLLDGRLADLGLLDADVIRQAIDDPAPSRNFKFLQIMELVDAEAWARSWD